jgi:hypothetical protein
VRPENVVRSIFLLDKKKWLGGSDQRDGRREGEGEREREIRD